MGQATPFVVFTASRSGSSWLLDLLSSHPAVLAYGELFSIDGISGGPAYGSPGVNYFESEPAPERSLYLDQLYASRPGIGAIGFKLVYGQAARRPGLLQELSAVGARAVHLMRANLLEAVVSFEVAKANGHFHVRQGEPAPLARVRIDAAEIRARLVQQDEMLTGARGRLDRMGFTRIEVFYEELVKRRQETIARVLRFLRVDNSVELVSTFARGPGSISDRIENFEEVCDALAGTRFEWMLGAVSRHEEPVASSFG